MDWSFGWASAGSEEESKVVIYSMGDCSGSEYEGTGVAPGDILNVMDNMHMTRAENGDLYNREGSAHGPPQTEAFDAGDWDKKDVTERVREWTAAGKWTCGIGGDHTLLNRSFKGVVEAGLRPRLIYMDAHPDLWELDKLHYAGTLKYLLTEELVNTEDVLMVGTRSWNAKHWQEARDTGLAVTDLLDPMSQLDQVKGWLWGKKGTGEPMRPYYISVDIDVVDPAFAPGVTDPVPGGLSSCRSSVASHPDRSSLSESNAGHSPAQLEIR